MSNLGDRSKYIGASDMGRIMRGDWFQLWLEKTQREPGPDFTDNLAVHLGINTEALNIAWFCRQAGRVLDPNAPKTWTHKEHAFLRCHPDAVLLDRELIEAKFCGAYVKEHEVVERYYPQCQAQLAIIGAPACHLSVIWGSPSWKAFKIMPDPVYIAGLIGRACEFWRHVETDTEPAGKAAVQARIELDKMRELDMSGSNIWASLAGDWLKHRKEARAFDIAVNGIKGEIPPDVKRAFGYGIEARRARNGAITIKET